MGKNNSGLSSVISLGPYEGGRLWVEGYGNEPPPCLCIQNSEEDILLGGYLDAHQNG